MLKTKAGEVINRVKPAANTVVDKYKQRTEYRRIGKYAQIGRKTRAARRKEGIKAIKKGAVVGGLVGAMSHAHAGGVLMGAAGLTGAAIGGGIAHGVKTMKFRKENKVLNKQAKQMGFTKRSRMRID